MSAETAVAEAGSGRGAFAVVAARVLDRLDAGPSGVEAIDTLNAAAGKAPARTGGPMSADPTPPVDPRPNSIDAEPRNSSMRLKLKTSRS